MVNLHGRGFDLQYLALPRLTPSESLELMVSPRFIDLNMPSRHGIIIVNFELECRSIPPRNKMGVVGASCAASWVRGRAAPKPIPHLRTIISLHPRACLFAFYPLDITNCSEEIVFESMNPAATDYSDNQHILVTIKFPRLLEPLQTGFPMGPRLLLPVLPA